MAFRDVFPSYLDQYLPGEDDSDQADIIAPRRRRQIFDDSGDVEDERRALQDVIPETQSNLSRFGQGLSHDVGDLGTALASPIYYGAREVYRTLADPKVFDSLEKASHWCQSKFFSQSHHSILTLKGE